MADLSDVSASLRALVSQALYPPALYPSGPAGISVAGIAVLVQSGWPDPASLQKQVGETPPRAQVTVYPQPTERNVTRYQQVWEQSGPLQTPTFTLASSGQVITVGGAQPSTFYGQNFAVVVNGTAYVYRSIANDTPSTIAAALAALIGEDIPGILGTEDGTELVTEGGLTISLGPTITVSGPAITLPPGARIGALRVGTQAPIGQEVKRQERYFSLIVWAPTTASRDKIASYIDVAIPQNKFLTLADGTRARLIYKGSPYSDFDQKQGIYRRDFSVSVEYATLASDMAAEVIAIEMEYFLNDTAGLLGTETGAVIDTETGLGLQTIAPDLTTYI